jgi:pyruvate/2-oxoglutarate dehydrogenase complex dihydrolipoamide dehydrogenase (E3) component
LDYWLVSKVWGSKQKRLYCKTYCRETVQLLKLSDESEEQIIADAVIFTCGNINNHLSIDHKTPLKVYLIGDAKQPRGIMEAIYEGEMVAEDIAANEYAILVRRESSSDCC